MAKLREVLKEGKIVGFRHNNVHIGDKLNLQRFSPVKRKKVTRDDNVDVNLYLCAWNMPPVDDPDPETTDYVALQNWNRTWDADNQQWVYNSTAAPYDPSYYSSPYAVSVPSAITLMDLITTYLGNSSSAAPYISSIEATDSWLIGFKFHDSDGVDFYDTDWYYDTTGIGDGGYSWIDDDTMKWSGGSWMYFLGNPDAQINYIPDPDNPDPHPSPYPDLLLSQFTVSDLVGAYGGAFTLSYEMLSVTFDVSTKVVNGETVHTLTRKA
jgi:hypothetical protein